MKNNEILNAAIIGAAASDMLVNKVNDKEIVVPTISAIVFAWCARKGLTPEDAIGILGAACINAINDKNAEKMFFEARSKTEYDGNDEDDEDDEDEEYE